eukprot:2115797-Amphidinium_carterae.1
MAHTLWGLAHTCPTQQALHVIAVLVSNMAPKAKAGARAKGKAKAKAGFRLAARGLPALPAPLVPDR